MHKCMHHPLAEHLCVKGERQRQWIGRPSKSVTELRGPFIQKWSSYSTPPRPISFVISTAILFWAHLVHLISRYHYCCLFVLFCFTTLELGHSFSGLSLAMPLVIIGNTACFLSAGLMVASFSDSSALSVRRQRRKQLRRRPCSFIRCSCSILRSS